jgi:hypothetical protein
MIWILLPLVPAILIYRLFPSSTVAVSGPLANLTVRATGAFAAYLIIFAAMYLHISDGMDQVGTFQHPYWTIEGKVKLLDSAGTPVQSDELIGSLAVTTSPRPYVAEDYHVTMYVPELDKLPYLVLEVPGFGRTSIDLRETGGIKTDRFHKTIEITTPITITRIPARTVGAPGPSGNQIQDLLRSVTRAGQNGQ